MQKDTETTKSKDLAPPTAAKPLTVVGVGSSAGGLEALQIMIANLPDDTNMSFIVAQHLSPSHKSMMVDLLVKDAPIPVFTAVDGEALRANALYICPPNHNIEISRDNKIVLTSYVEARRTPRPSIDMLFESIATHKGDDAIGIILSGTGSDGSRGIRAIKAENGFGIVQDPNTAKYDGMPNSAINSGNVDLIVSPEQIGAELKSIVMFPRDRTLIDDKNIPRETYIGIIRQLKLHSKVDFSLYKENTILRRIDRRMTSLKIAKSEDYLQHLSNHREEVTFLFNDMLIGVTSFFRDIRAYETLRRELQLYLATKTDKIIRVWSAGCSTGEEPYTLAMIISDILGDKKNEYKIQIFATDIDEQAISFAREASYPESALQNLPKEIKTRFFTVNGDQYEVIKSIKAMVIFSLHDINKDPPFLRLDLITCRNLMIYFTAELQRMLLPTFHYALNPGGLLLLGISESIGLFQEQYRVISKAAKLYQAVLINKSLPPERVRPSRRIPDYIEPTPAVERQSLTPAKRLDLDYSALIMDALKDRVLPNALLINENQDIIFSEGNNELLVRSQGIPSNNVFKNFHPKLGIELRSSLHEIDTGKSFVDTGYQNIKLKDDNVWVRMMLVRVDRSPPLGRLTVIFTDIERPFALPSIKDIEGNVSTEVVKEQERLLNRTRDQLQNVIEELETSNEEMQAMNEELQSSNEELQSSNEELETTNEELQSTNEELQTAYAELRMAYEEKEQQQSELQVLRTDLMQANNLLHEAEKIGLSGSWMWDIENRRLTWSKGCFALFDLDDNDYQPSFEAFIGLVHADDRNRLETQMKEMLIKQVKLPITFKVGGTDQVVKVISLDAVVSFNELKQATKVMGTMTDITEKTHYEKNTSAYKDKINYILTSSLNCAYIYNFIDEHIEYVNPTLTQQFGFSLADLEDFSGEAFFNLFAGDEVAKIKQHFDRVRTGSPGATYPSKYAFKKRDPNGFTPVYANHTVYDLDDTTGYASKMLVTFFAAE
ncbi:chemotaxis protein CheB [Zhongshania borealis]